MTDTLTHLGFKLSEIGELSNLQEHMDCDTDGFESILMCDEPYTRPEFEPTLKDKLQEMSDDVFYQEFDENKFKLLENEISILSDVTFEDHISITPQSTGIEASDVSSLFQQFLEYEQASDVDPLSYAGSSIMSPEASPGEENEDVLGRLMCVQEKLSREVGSDGEVIVDVVCNDNLIMNIPSEDKLLRTVNGIHPKGNLCRTGHMADSPKFAKFKKKRLTKEPPLRIASSLPNTPRCTSPSDIVSSEERKHMEIKLIEALALPMPNKNGKISVSKDTQKKVAAWQKDSLKKSNGCITLKKSGGCLKRKLPPVEPTPSRLLPVVSKRQRQNNLDKAKLKDPRLNLSPGGNIDPRLNKADYGTKSNVIQLQNTKLFELNSSTNTATETVDDVGIIDMTIDHENLPETFIYTPDIILNQKQILYSEIQPLDNEGAIETVEVSEIGVNGIMVNGIHPINETVPINGEVNGTVDISETVLVSESFQVNGLVSLNNTVDLTVVENGIATPIDTMNGDVLSVVEFPSISAIEIKTEEVCEPIKEICNTELTEIRIKEEITSGVIKPPKNYRKGLNSMTNSVVDTFASASEHESDDDDRAYHRKKSSRKSRVSSNPRTSHGSSVKSEIMRSSSLPRKSLKDRRHSRNRSRSHNRQRSESPSLSKLRSDNNKYSDESLSDRSDTEIVDISSKLIELSNPVPYDIEHERKLRFLSGGASKGIGERKNIYAGGITEDTTKAELADRFGRFGEIVKITLHFREKGDNYAFIVFDDPDNAMRAIEEGNDEPGYPHLDLCFGGRRKFVGGSYVDFDGNNRYLEESDKVNVNNRNDEPEEDDFDRLLKIAMLEKKKREAAPPHVEVKKRDPTPPESPEWS